MNIVALGYKFEDEYDDVAEARVRSTTSLLDFDAVVWDPSTLIDEYHASSMGRYQGLPSLGDDASFRIQDDIRRRRAELDEMLKLGRGVVIFTPPPAKCFVATGKTTTSGT